MAARGRGISGVHGKVTENFAVACNDADRPVRTEAAYVRNQAALERYRRDGRRKVRRITGPQDGRECAICLERADKVYLLGSKALIPAHPRCRCCYAPVVELEGENVAVTGLTADEERGTMKVAFEATVADGLGISVKSVHAGDQSRARVVSDAEIRDALRNPLYIRPDKLDAQGRPSRRYIGSNATVNREPGNRRDRYALENRHKDTKKVRKGGVGNV